MDFIEKKWHARVPTHKIMISLVKSIIALSLITSISTVRPVLAAVDPQIIKGKIYTVDPNNPWVDALAIDENGILVSVGTMEEAMEALNGTTNDSSTSTDIGITDYGTNRLILPGFHDVHLHAVEAGINQKICYADEFIYPEDLPFYVDRCNFGGQGWIVAAGVDISFLLSAVFDEGSRYPIGVLDRNFPRTPVLILDNLGHGAVANTLAFEIVGYDKLTTDPPGGRLLRDDEGRLLGIVDENAQQLLRNAAFPDTQGNRQTAYGSLLDAIQILNRNGITSVSDAGGFWKQAQTKSWQSALDDGKLTVRASNALYIYPDELMDTQLPQLMERFSNDENSLLRFNQAKIYVDGILSLQTSALKEPYTNANELENEMGFEYFGTGNNLNQVSQMLVNAGFQLHFHVTGDRGASLALDAIEAVGSETGPHRLTHCYLVDEVDRPRFQQLGVIADFQWAPSSLERAYGDSLVSTIGQTRVNELLPAVQVHEAGGTITMSSDWDADELSPLVKLELLVTTTRPGGYKFDSLETVIPFLTINGAKLLQQEEKTGSLQVGKYADLVVMDRNIFEIPASQISNARVDITMLQGKVVYDRSVSSAPPMTTVVMTTPWSIMTSIVTVVSMVALI